ncbi:MAG: CopD family protein [Opitutales bacterium]|nr:CopD family protein [Opitutales bacterium]
MSSAYNWFKILHIFFVIGWMCGIFYMPRIMVHYQLAKREGEGVTRLVKMARKLYNFSSLMMLFATGFGMVLWIYFGISGGWMHAKLLLVAVLMVHHHLCARFIKQMEKDTLQRSSVFFRWFNEYPTIVMLIIIILVIAKPF